MGCGSEAQECAARETDWAERSRKFRAEFRSGCKPTIPALLAKVEKELAAGYQRIKIKIKPGTDIALVSALRERFPRIRLMVDANSAYTLKDTPLLKALDAFYLIMIEQPLGWDDIFSHVQLQRQLRNADLPRRMHPRTRPSPRRHRDQSMRHYQYQAGTRGWAHGRAAHARSLPGEFDSGLVRRNARIRHRTRAQHRDVVASPTLIFQVTCRLVDATGRKTSLSRKLKFPATARFVFPRLLALVTRRASTASRRSLTAAKSSSNT